MIEISLAFYAVSVFFLTLYAMHAWLMLFYYIKDRKKMRAPKKKKLNSYPVVTVQLPVYNEKYVIERLIRKVCELDYPQNKLEIQILDDSTDETTLIAERLVEEYKRKGFDIKLLHRENRKGYKAGALSEGLKKAKGEFIAIFDADFLPPKDFLKRTIPYFKDPNIAVVQTMWGHINAEESILTKVQSILLDTHFYIEQYARNRHGYFITFNGTAGIWRKKAIEDAGGWDGNILAEDVDLSYRAQLKGWKMIFLPHIKVPAELPADIESFKNQQYRWAKGTIQAGKKLLPLIWSSNLSLLKKFEATVHLSAHLVYPFMLILALFLLPLLFAKNSPKDYRGYFYLLGCFSVFAFPYMFLYVITIKKLYRSWKKRIYAIPFVISAVMALTISNTIAVLEGFLGKPSEFVRTPKKGNKKINFKKRKLKLSTIIELIMGIYMSITFLYAVFTTQFSVLVFIALYAMGFLYISIPVISAYIEDKKQEVIYGRQEIT